MRTKAHGPYRCEHHPDVAVSRFAVRASANQSLRRGSPRSHLGQFQQICDVPGPLDDWHHRSQLARSEGGSDEGGEVPNFINAPHDQVGIGIVGICGVGNRHGRLCGSGILDRAGHCLYEPQSGPDAHPPVSPTGHRNPMVVVKVAGRQIHRTHDVQGVVEHGQSPQHTFLAQHPNGDRCEVLVVSGAWAEIRNQYCPWDPGVCRDPPDLRRRRIDPDGGRYHGKHHISGERRSSRSDALVGPGVGEVGERDGEVRPRERVDQ